MNNFKFSRALSAFVCLATGAVIATGCGSKTGAPDVTAPQVVKTTIPATSPANKPALQAETNGTPVPTATMMNARDMKPDTKNYRVRGLIKSIEKSSADGRTTLNVSHETIPGFMPAMTMRLPFAKNDDAKKVKVGDKIAFDVNRTNLETSNFQVLPPATALKLK